MLDLWMLLNAVSTAASLLGRRWGGGGGGCEPVVFWPDFSQVITVLLVYCFYFCLSFDSVK